jgi:nucleoside-diphosphate-sugar epimerase
MTAPTTRAKRPVLLIVGCGDVGLRVLGLLHRRWRVLALTSSVSRVPALREAGAVPLLGDLDVPASLARLAGLADAVLHLAPPAAQGESDHRTLHLLRTLALRGGIRRIVYASTTGVYGDSGGAWIDETRSLAPATARGRRRADAEARLRWAGRAFGWRISLLRVPGIYALDREGGDPRDRVRRGAPVLRPEDDVFTNHIHADDLARACVAALCRGAPQRAYNVCDFTELKMGDHFDAVADRFGLPRPPRISRAEAQAHMTPVQLSFLSESRRLSNRRLVHELRLRLRYPTVAQGLGG